MDQQKLNHLLAAKLEALGVLDQVQEHLPIYLTGAFKRLGGLIKVDPAHRELLGFEAGEKLTRIFSTLMVAKSSDGIALQLQSSASLSSKDGVGPILSATVLIVLKG